MKLSGEQLETFRRDGLLILPGLFSADEVAAIRTALAPLFGEECDANIREKTGTVARTVMGLHQRDELFDRLVRHPRLVEPARRSPATTSTSSRSSQREGRVRGRRLAVALRLRHHHRDDGVPAPHALNLHILLDEVSHYNGPLYFIPGSHRHEPLPRPRRDEHELSALGGRPRDGHRPHRGGRHHARNRPARHVLIFGDLMVHGSPGQHVAMDRAIFSLILNPVATPRPRSPARVQAPHGLHAGGGAPRRLSAHAGRKHV